MSAWKVIPGISRWLLSMIERGFTLQFRRRPPRFNGVVQSLTLPRNAQVLRQEVCCVLEKSSRASLFKWAGERFLQPLFLGTQKGWGLRPILDLRPINRVLCKRPFRMITLKQILAQIRPRDWFASVDLKDAYFHIQITQNTASPTLSEVFLRGHSLPKLCSPVRAGFGPKHFFKMYGCSTFPLQSERDAHSQLSGRLADFSSVPGHATQPYSFVTRAMCQHAEEHSRPESVYNISGDVLRLCGDAGPPLSGALGGHFVFPAPFQARQLCSLHMYYTCALYSLHSHLCIYQMLLSKATYSAFRLYIFCQYVCSLGIKPTTFALLTQCSNRWATGTLQPVMAEIKILPLVLYKIREEGALVTLIDPNWPNQPWFPDLTELLVARPWPIPIRRDLLSQVNGSVWHLNPELWSLHVWLLRGYQRSWAPCILVCSTRSWRCGLPLRDVYMLWNGECLWNGAVKSISTRLLALCWMFCVFCSTDWIMDLYHQHWKYMWQLLPHFVPRWVGNRSVGTHWWWVFLRELGDCILRIQLQSRHGTVRWC